MEILTTFFAGVIAFLNGLLGFTPAVTKVQPVVTNSVLIVSSTQEVLATSTQQNQIDVFTDPELRYKLVIPTGMVYQYDKEFKNLYIWSKKDHSGRVDFSISYVSPEEQDYFQPLIEREKNRVVTLKTKELAPIYNPSVTEACHEEARIPAKGDGFLLFYNACGDDELRPLFDKVIGNIEILK